MKQRTLYGISTFLVASVLALVLGAGCGGNQEEPPSTGTNASGNVTQKTGSNTTGQDINPTDTGNDTTETGSTGSTGSTGTTGVVPPLNAVPPKVTASTPADGATNVPIGTPITVTFDRTMTGSTVLYRIRLGESTDNVTFHSVLGNATTSDNKTFTFTPSSSLKKNLYYRLIVDVGAWDTNGVSMDQRFKASFTSEYGAPAVASVDPANGDYSGTSPTITVTFDCDMIDTTVYANFKLLQGGTTVSTHYTKINDHTYALTTNSTLSGSTTYTVRVETGAQSLHHIPLDFAFTSTFKTF